ncbi:MAG: D-alanine--D-alanine ligase family protein [Ilumatobacteraceae bacterium]
MGTGDRIKLVVLFGGQSAEHDVSCTTAAHVLRAADSAKYDITPVGISRDGAWAISDGAQLALASGPTAIPDSLDPTGTAIMPADVISETTRTVVVPLLHGPMGEDGTVQGLLELANIPYVGSGVLGSALSMDKAMAKQVLSANGVEQARYRAFRAHEITPALPAKLAAELALPLFVKPANMGSSVGVSKAKTVEDVRDAIDSALTYDEWVVVEEAVVGREIEVAVLGNLEPRASLPGEIVPGAEFYDYADKYLDEGSQTLVPAPLTTEQADSVRAMAVQVFKVLRCEGLARVDFFFEEHGRGFICNEVNTMPGFTPISMYPKMWIASGLSYPELIDELVSLAIERHGRQRRNTAH